MKHQRQYHFFVLLTLAILLLMPSYVFADDLDDISIQVIGLDEIPSGTLERIPMPSPDFGGLADIRHKIIPRQSATEKMPAGGVSGPATSLDGNNPSPPE